MQIAAGHGFVKINGDFVIKRMNHIEILFYRKLEQLQNQNPALAKIMPRLLATNENQIAAITRVGVGLCEPQVCDIKIGFKTFSGVESFLNRKKYSPTKAFKMAFVDMIQGSKVRGYRLEGITQTSEKMLQLNPRKSLRNFFGKSPDIYLVAIKELMFIREVMAKQDFTFVGSSVLVALDKNKKNLEIQLIDFAHPFFKQMNEEKFGKLQINFLRGLDNLICHLQKIRNRRLEKAREVDCFCLKMKAPLFLEEREKWRKNEMGLPSKGF